MPFTFSHPALILPLAGVSKRWISMTALIIGSITPDFEYFIRMRILADHSHTLPGVFYFDLPLGIVLTYLFHGIIRDTLIDNLPLPLKQRAVPIKYFNWNFYFRRHYLVVISSLLIGIFSHLLWDGFTHESGEFVKALPGLRTLHHIFGKDMYLYRMIQHSSTLIGLFITAAAFWKLPAHRYVSPQIDSVYWIIIASVTLAVTIFRTAITSPEDFRYTQTIVTVIMAAIVGLTVAPTLLKLFNERTTAQ